jgi:hypothetical protein
MRLNGAASTPLFYFFNDIVMKLKSMFSIGTAEWLAERTGANALEDHLRGSKTLFSSDEPSNL